MSRFSSKSCAASDPDDRIVGGTEVPPGKHPWAAYIQVGRSLSQVVHCRHYAVLSVLRAGVRQGGQLGRQEDVHDVRRQRHQQQVDPHRRALLLLETLRTAGRKRGHPRK